MNLSDRDATGVADREDISNPAPLVGALRSLYRAIQKSAIYPSGHPSIPEAVRGAIDLLRQALAERPSLVVGVTRDHLLCDGERLGESGGTLRPLAALLHQLDLAALEVDAGISAGELDGLVQFLARARVQRLRGERLVEELTREPIRMVRLCAIDYRALRFSDGLQPDAPDETARPALDPWEGLSRLLTDPATYTSAMRFRQLGDEMAQQIECREGAGLGELRELVHDAVRKLPGERPDQRAVVRQRLAAFLSGLHPDLRRDLLRVDAAMLRTSLTLLGELAEHLPLPELIEALAGIDRAGGRVPDEMVSLLGKLSRIAEKRTQHGDLLRDTLESWGLNPQALDPRHAPQRALEEILQRRNDAEYNPDSYRTLLSRIASETLTGTAHASALRYRDPRDLVDVRVHAAELAVLLLGRSDGAEHRKSLLAWVETATDLLVEQERFATLTEATLAARAHSVLKSDSESTRRAARAYLDGFTQSARIDAIVRHGCREDHVAEDALTLLSLGGVRALDRVLDQLGEARAPDVVEPLCRFARERGAEGLARVLEGRAQRGRQALEPVFLVLRELPTADTVPLLDRLLAHPDYLVRRRALLLLCEIDHAAGSPERHLRRALGDAHHRVVTLAIQRLTALDGPEASDLLGAYLAGELPGVAPHAGGCRRAARGLLKRGDAGCERLCHALRALLHNPRPRDVRLAKVVVECLSEVRERPLVRRTLRHWQFSLARLVGLLLPRTKRPAPRAEP